MKTVRWLSVCVVVLLGAAAQGAEKENKLPAAVVTALEKAAELEIYSLDGERDVKDGWHGVKVLGKTAAKGDEAKKVVALLVKGVAEGSAPARCFVPRHGVRVVHEKKTYDLLICFECSQIHIYTDGAEKAEMVVTSDNAHKALDAVLTAAKVPLARPAK